MLSASKASVFAVLLINAAAELQIDDFYRLKKDEAIRLQQTCGTRKSDEKLQDDVYQWALLFMSTSASAEQRTSCTAALISRYHAIISAQCLLFLEHGFRNVNVTTMYFLFGGYQCVVDRGGGKANVSKNCRLGGHKRTRQLNIRSIIVPATAYYRLIELKTLVPVFRREFFGDLALVELLEPLADDDPDFRPICMYQFSTDFPKSFTAFWLQLSDDEGENALEKFLELNKLPIKRNQVLREKTCIKNVLVAKFGCKASIILVPDVDNQKSGFEMNNMSFLSSFIDGQYYLIGIASFPEKYSFVPEQRMMPKSASDVITKISFYHDFICFYTGVCPLGYNIYNEKSYWRDPEVVIFLKDGEEGNYIDDEYLVRPVNFADVDRGGGDIFHENVDQNTLSDETEETSATSSSEGSRGCVISVPVASTSPTSLLSSTCMKAYPFGRSPKNDVLLLATSNVIILLTSWLFF